MKFSDSFESTIEAGHSFLTENIQPENKEAKNIPVYRELTNFLKNQQKFLKILGLKLNFIALHCGMSSWNCYLVKHLVLSHIP